MRTAVDTSVLVAIAKGEASAKGWVRLLAQSAREGELLLNDIVAAEYYSLVDDEALYRSTLEGLGLSYSPVSETAAQEAGRIFRRYRCAGGPREHLIPDFLIGAHALLQADHLAADDRGFYRLYFEGLSVLRPR